MFSSPVCSGRDYAYLCVLSGDPLRERFCVLNMRTHRSLGGKRNHAACTYSSQKTLNSRILFMRLRPVGQEARLSVGVRAQLLF